MTDTHSTQPFDPRRTERRVWVPDNVSNTFNNSETVPFNEDPMQPSHGYSDSRSKKGSSWLWIILAMVLVAGGVCAWYFLVYSKDASEVEELVVDDDEPSAYDELVEADDVDASEYAPAMETPAPAPTPARVTTPTPTAVTPTMTPQPVRRTQTIDEEPAAPATPAAPTRSRQTIDDDDPPARRQQMD
ncbi:MAG: hypothetical protein ACI31C_09190 [Muribaculaceae bacterium]